MNRRDFMKGATAAVSVAALKGTTAIVAAHQLVWGSNIVAMPEFRAAHPAINEALTRDVGLFGRAFLQRTGQGVERVDPHEVWWRDVWDEHDRTARTET